MESEKTKQMSKKKQNSQQQTGGCQRQRGFGCQ